jgi:IclR family transcriptional regulator, acetate operon repressor
MPRLQVQTKAAPRYPIGSVDRVLQLLLLFRDRSSIRVADAASELGVAGSTAHRLLAMLQVHGFIAQDGETRQYVPGPAILELGSAVHRHGSITELAQTATEELSERLNETAHVSVLQHTSAVFIAGTESRHALRIANQTGRRIEAFHSAPGKAMLADLPPERLQVLYPSEALTDTFNGVTMQRAELEAELEEVRVNGYATNDVPNTNAAGDFLSIAVPIRREGTVIAALSVAAPAQRATPDWSKRALKELRRSAASLEGLIK